jgi:hypothetical protein
MHNTLFSGGVLQKRITNYAQPVDNSELIGKGIALQVEEWW